jgi:iron complex outermembrane recepter protein
LKTQGLQALESSGHTCQTSVLPKMLSIRLSACVVLAWVHSSPEQSVGVFVDGVHLGKSRQTRLGLFDLERVEVLRGPQGILFGKNTLAGAINVTSAASPVLGGDLEGRIAISSESFDGRIYEGWLQTSITDTFALRFALKDRQLDGYLDNSLASADNGATPDGPTTDEQIWRLSAK